MRLHHSSFPLIVSSAVMDELRTDQTGTTKVNDSLGYNEHWQEAMAYLWKGWPERVQAGPSAPRAQEILIPGEGWELVAEGHSKWVYSYRINEDGTLSNKERFFHL